MFSTGDNRAVGGVLLTMPSLHMDTAPFKRESFGFWVDFYSLRCQLQNLNEAIFWGLFSLQHWIVHKTHFFPLIFHS